MPSTFITAKPLDFGSVYIQFSHKRGGPDLSRVKQGQLNLFDGHNYELEDILGRVTKASHNANETYGDIAFSSFDSPKIQFAKHLVEEEGFKGLSAGIRGLSPERENGQYNGKPLYIVDKWMLVEMSMTGIPRDPDTNIAKNDYEDGKHVESRDSQFILDSTGGVYYMSAGKAQEAQEDKTNDSVGDDVMGDLSTLNLDDITGALQGAIVNGVTEAFKAQKAEEDAFKASEAERLAAEAKDAEIERLKAENEALKTASEGANADGTTDADNDAGDDVVANREKQLTIVNGLVGFDKSYDQEKLGHLKLEVMQNDIGEDDFASKIKSLTINPEPVAPNKSEPSDGYSMARVGEYLRYGVEKLAAYEIDRSLEIVRKSDLNPYLSNGIAIPMEEIAKNSGYITSSFQNSFDATYEMASASTAGGGNTDISTAIGQTFLEFYRSDLPDPLDIMDRVTRVPGRPGNELLIAITSPQPGQVAEPGDGGYAKTGDASSARKEIDPTIMALKTPITRLANVQSPGFFDAVFSIASQKFDEEMSKQVVAGGNFGANAANRRGIYNHPSVGNTGGVGSTTVANAAAVTVAVMDAALNQSFKSENRQGSNRTIIVSPQVRDVLRNLSRANMSNPYVVNDVINGVAILATQIFGAKVARGIVGALAEVYLKTWDDAVYVTRREQDGILWLVMEMFWNYILRHQDQFHRLHQA